MLLEKLVVRPSDGCGNVYIWTTSMNMSGQSEFLVYFPFVLLCTLQLPRCLCLMFSVLSSSHDQYGLFQDHNHAQCGITECSKLKDLKTAFLTDDATTICLEILEKGDLQVAGKEREAQLSLQFRDIATIVMENTINPDTKRPYSITMIERLMHDIHFAVDPHKSSKKQALDVIHRLVKKFPIKRSPMRLRLTVGEQNFSTVLEKIGTWNGEIVTMDESGTQFSLSHWLSGICFHDPA
ncbi:uncharacterized protein [Spinacia oleracea]|uniref:Ribosome maturation protein SBDS n=1 Tax=Spinacia oleracea TaxID=3562 RepID=A0ABM3RP47_SPIOL|nr:uncharacterized protein LOC110781705 [Spinacia oleracea]